MQPEGWLPLSQDPTNFPCPEQVETSPRPFNRFLNMVSLLQPGKIFFKFMKPTSLLLNVTQRLEICMKIQYNYALKEYRAGILLHGNFEYKHIDEKRLLSLLNYHETWVAK